MKPSRPVYDRAGFLLFRGMLKVQNVITDIDGIEVGHHTDLAHGTGCTVVLCRHGAVGGVDVRGGAPGTRETDLLRPSNQVQRLHAVLLTGGSAFGLAAADGVMSYLEAHRIGFAVGANVVPIVPAAVLFDLNLIGGEVRPSPGEGRRACEVACSGEVQQGTAGAGTGATVGKARGMERAVKGGIGTASIALSGGVVVAALVAVNAYGGVVDHRTGEIVAGPRCEPRPGFHDTNKLLLEGRDGARGIAAGENTTIGVVATNATLNKAKQTTLPACRTTAWHLQCVPATHPATATPCSLWAHAPVQKLPTLRNWARPPWRPRLKLFSTPSSRLQVLVACHRSVSGAVAERIGFIGAGKLAAGLSMALCAHGYEVSAFASRSAGATQRLASLLPAAEAVAGPAEVAVACDVVFITTPDGAIEEVCELCAGGQGRESSTVVGRSRWSPWPVPPLTAHLWHPFTPCRRCPASRRPKRRLNVCRPSATPLRERAGWPNAWNGWLKTWEGRSYELPPRTALSTTKQQCSPAGTSLRCWARPRRCGRVWASRHSRRELHWGH